MARMSARSGCPSTPPSNRWLIECISTTTNCRSFCGEGSHRKMPIHLRSSKRFLAATGSLVLLIALAPLVTDVLGQPAGGPTNETSVASRPKVPDLGELLGSLKTNEMRAVAQRYQADRGNLTRFYNVAIAPDRCARLRSFGEDWLTAVQRLDPVALSEDARSERTRLLDNIGRDLRQVEEQARAQAQIGTLIPFAKIIFDLDERRRRVEKVDARQTAGVVDELAKTIART